MNAFIVECIKANKEIYNYINQNLTQDDFLYQGSLGFGGDKSLNMDLKAEGIFIKYLSSFGNIYSEEIGFVKTLNKNQKNTTIIIDPLDGSNNFASSHPYYGTSVALECDGKVIIGIVCNLVDGSIIIRDENNILNRYDFDANLIKHENFEYSQSKIGIFERSYAYPNLCLKLHDNKLKFRSPGAVALSISCAKQYEFVLFCGNIREFDVKAALYICNDLNIYQTKEIILVSKNKEIFCQIKEFIKQ